MEDFITSNLLTIIFIIVAVTSFIAGYKKGFIAKILSFASFILAIILARLFTPIVANGINEATNINKGIADSLYNAIMNSDSVGQIKNIPNLQSLPDISEINPSAIPELSNLTDILNNPWLKNIDLSNIEEGIHTISQGIADSIVSIVCGIILFIVLFILLKFLAKAVHVINYIPIIGSLNKILGGLLSIAEIVIVLWIAFAILRAMENLPTISDITNYIKASPLVSLIYSNNFIYNFFANLFNSSFGPKANA